MKIIKIAQKRAILQPNPTMPEMMLQINKFISRYPHLESCIKDLMTKGVTVLDGIGKYSIESNVDGWTITRLPINKKGPEKRLYYHFDLEGALNRLLDFINQDMAIWKPEYTEYLEDKREQESDKQLEESQEWQEYKKLLGKNINWYKIAQDELRGDIGLEKKFLHPSLKQRIIEKFRERFPDISADLEDMIAWYKENFSLEEGKFDWKKQIEKAKTPRRF